MEIGNGLVLQITLFVQEIGATAQSLGGFNSTSNRSDQAAAPQTPLITTGHTCTVVITPETAAVAPKRYHASSITLRPLGVPIGLDNPFLLP